MKKKPNGTFKIILPVLALLGVAGLVAFDYLSDGCISSMGGADVCGDDAREQVYGMIVIFVVCVAVAAIGRFRMNRQNKT